MLAAIAFFCGVKDLHFENAIISKNNFFIIDTDVAFQSKVIDLSQTNLFDAQGAMSNGSSPKHYYFNHPLICNLTIQQNEKNKLWEIENNEIKPYSFDKNSLFDGFKNIHSIIKNHNDDIVNWFKTNEKLLTSMYVRVLPINTGAFYSLLDSYLTSDLLDNVFFSENNNEQLFEEGDVI